MLATACPRSIESAALARAAAELQNASARADTDYPAFIEALSRNLTLWTLLATDAARPGNLLPLELRRAVIRLAAFVRVQTLRLQRSKVSADVETLVEINRNIAEGLGRSNSVVGHA